MNLYKVGQKNLDMKIFGHENIIKINETKRWNKRAIYQNDFKHTLVLLRKNTDVNFSEGATTHVG